MILFNPKLDVLVDNIETDNDGRYLLLQATIHDFSIQLCNIYSPNNNCDQKMFFSNVIDVLKSVRATALLSEETSIAH